MIETIGLGLVGFAAIIVVVAVFLLCYLLLCQIFVDQMYRAQLAAMAVVGWVMVMGWSIYEMGKGLKGL